MFIFVLFNHYETSYRISRKSQKDERILGGSWLGPERVWFGKTSKSTCRRHAYCYCLTVTKLCHGAMFNVAQINANLFSHPASFGPETVHLRRTRPTQHLCSRCTLIWFRTLRRLGGASNSYGITRLAVWKSFRQSKRPYVVPKPVQIIQSQISNLINFVFIYLSSLSTKH